MGKNLTNIILYKTDGSSVPLQNRHTTTGISSAKQTWALNADDVVDIVLVSTSPQSFDIGDRITIFGRDYKLNQLPTIKKNGQYEFEYDLHFEGVQYDLLRVTYDLTIDTTSNALQDISGDSLIGNLYRFMEVLIANLNRVFPNQWILGNCPETIKDKTLSFGEDDNCLSVLQNLCNESNFNVEFDIVKDANTGAYIINLFEKVGQVLPYTFKYGKGNGLYELIRNNVSSSNIITRLKAYGSTQNITQKYRADRLCLPNKTKGMSYIEKPEAVAKYGIFEGRKHFEDIKPTYTGTVTALGGNIYSFVDSNFPFDLTEKEQDGKTTKYLIDGLEAKIHFNTGNLAGYDFTIKSYNHETKTFVLNPFKDERGEAFPSAKSLAFQIQETDTYKITDIAYPQAIEEAAELLLEEKANEYYDIKRQPQVQYSLKIAKEYLSRLVEETESVVQNVFMPGDYMHIVDDDILVDKSIRIKSFVRDILEPMEYSLTIADIVSNTSIINRVVSEIGKIDKVVKMNDLNNPIRARADWRSSREVMDMVFDVDGDYYTNKIKPESIDTVALSVGAKSMQFGLQDTIFEPNFDGNVNVLKWKGGVLQHYTISESSAVVWNLEDGQVTVANSAKPYYIYAKCAKNPENGGTIIVSDVQHKVGEDSQYWFFWLGVLNSVDVEMQVRTISLTYGFTSINGRFVRTGRIMPSSGGNSFIDLDSGEFLFGSNDNHLSWEDDKLKLKGVLLQSQSGDESQLGVFRGIYNNNATYYNGDDVTYTHNGNTSTYRYISLTPSAGHNPTDSSYWMVVAQGAKGNTGVSPTFQGEWLASRSYIGNSLRCDVVKYITNGYYYIAKANAGTIPYGTQPTNTTYWALFGGQFDSVATTLLLADHANVGGFVFLNNLFWSQHGTVNGLPSTNPSATGFIPNIQIDGITGEIKSGENVKLKKEGLEIINGQAKTLVRNQSIATMISSLSPSTDRGTFTIPTASTQGQEIPIYEDDYQVIIDTTYTFSPPNVFSVQTQNWIEVVVYYDLYLNIRQGATLVASYPLAYVEDMIVSKDELGEQSGRSFTGKIKGAHSFTLRQNQTAELEVRMGVKKKGTGTYSTSGSTTISFVNSGEWFLQGKQWVLVGNDGLYISKNGSFVKIVNNGDNLELSVKGLPGREPSTSGKLWIANDGTLKVS